MTGVQVQRYPSRAAQAAELAKTVAAQLIAAVDRSGRASLAVPGGTTPGAFLAALAADDTVPWHKVSVLLTDERFVPETSDRSNTRLLREVFLQGPAGAAHLVPLTAEAADPEAVIDGLTEGVRAITPLDVCVLGMGADMHTASLFPGADRLNEALAADAAPLIPMRAPGAPEPRLTLSAPVLRAAGALHLLIAGRKKADTLAEAERPGPPSEAPVRAILTTPQGVTVHYAD